MACLAGGLEQGAQFAGGLRLGTALVAVPGQPEAGRDEAVLHAVAQSARPTGVRTSLEQLVRIAKGGSPRTGAERATIIFFRGRGVPFRPTPACVMPADLQHRIGRSALGEFDVDGECGRGVAIEQAPRLGPALAQALILLGGLPAPRELAFPAGCRAPNRSRAKIGWNEA